MSNLLNVIVLLNLYLAIACFTKKEPRAWIYVLLAVTGWTATIMWEHDYDKLPIAAVFWLACFRGLRLWVYGPEKPTQDNNPVY
jgi:hypothetical protein